MIELPAIVQVVTQLVVFAFQSRHDGFNSFFHVKIFDFRLNCCNAFFSVDLNYLLLIAIRLLIRHTLAAFVLGIKVLGSMSYVWFTIYNGDSEWLALLYATCFGLAIALLYKRVGILAGIIAIFVLRSHGLYMSNFDAWYASYDMVELAILLALAAYGFWVAIAGQPLFKDTLLTEKPARV